MMEFGMHLIAEARMELLVHKELQGQMERLEHRDQQDHKELQDQRDQQELPVQLAQQGHKVLRGRAADSTAGT